MGGPLVCIQHFPQIIVSRHFIYHWLAARGWDKSERGYSSLDYTVFARAKVDHPLTGDSERDFWLSKVEHDYRRTA